MQGFYTRIENDALDIAARLKEIDDGYFIVYNGYFKRLEVHNKKQGKNTFCLVVPSNLGKDQAEEYFLPKEEIKNLIGGKTVRKFVFIPGRLLNIVVG